LPGRVAAKIGTCRNSDWDVSQFQLPRVAVFAAPLCGQDYIVMRLRLHNYVVPTATLCSSGYITMWFQMPRYAVSAVLCRGFNHAKTSFRYSLQRKSGRFALVWKRFLNFAAVNQKPFAYVT